MTGKIQKDIDEEYIMAQMKPFSEDRYKNILLDIKDINLLFMDFNNYLDNQCCNLNMIENNIETTFVNAKNSESKIIYSNDIQTDNIKYITILYATIGTALIVSCGGIGIVIGIKPLTSIIIGSSIGITYHFYNSLFQSK